MTEDVLLGVAISGAVTASVFFKKISVAGGIIGGLTTYLLFLGVGWLGVGLIAGFFALGTLASGWKLRQKKKLAVAEAHDGQRGWRNVLANSGVAALLALLAWWIPSTVPLVSILVSATFAAALSDTWSSEFGNVYGRHFYNVLSGKKDRRGRDGVISGAGSLAGGVGSGLVAGWYGLFHQFGPEVAIIWFAGMVGNLADSVLGATLERRGIIGNHTVNFLNTGGAAAVAYFLVKY